MDKVLASLPPKSEIVDAGANTGGFTEKFAALGHRVFAFEPVPGLFSNLVQKFKDNEQVFVFPEALSDVADCIKVNVQSCWTLVPDGTAGLERASEYKDSQSFEMETCTLDEYFDLFGLEVSFIKMDVDGYEFKALRGARGCLMLCKPPIMLELNCYINKLGEDPKEFVQYLLDLGYVFWSMDGEVSMDSLDEIMAQWPYHSSYDVMLLPKGYEL